MTARCLALSLNSLYTLLGLVLTGSGVAALFFASDLIKKVDMLEFLDLDLFGYVVIAVGVLLLILSIIGFCGVLHEKRRLITCYAGTLIFVLLVNIALAVFLVVKYGDFKQYVDDELTERWPTASESSRDSFQDEFECCGYATIVDHPAGVCTSTVPCQEAMSDYLDDFYINLAIAGGCVLVVLLCSVCSFFSLRGKMGQSLLERKWTI